MGLNLLISALKKENPNQLQRLCGRWGGGNWKRPSCIFPFFYYDILCLAKKKVRCYKSLWNNLNSADRSDNEVRL